MQYLLADRIAEGATDVLAISPSVASFPGLLVKDGYVYYGEGKSKYKRIRLDGGASENTLLEFPVPFFGFFNDGPGDYVDGCIRTGADELYTFEGTLIADCGDMQSWPPADSFSINSVSNALGRIFQQYEKGDLVPAGNDVRVIFP